MAYVGVTNTSVALLSQGAASWIYATTEALKSAGWVVVAWGGGASAPASFLTYNVNGVANDNTLVSVATWNSTGAWKVLRDPSGTSGRQLFFGMGTASSNLVAVKYSKATGFSGGTQTAISWATTGGGDGQVLWSALSTDALTVSSASGKSFTGAAAAGYVQAVANNVAENGVYSVYSWTYVTGTGVPAGFFCFEPVAAGSYNSADQDPCYQVCIGGATAPSALVKSYTALAVSYWNKFGLAGASYLTAAQIAVCVANNSSNSASLAFWPTTIGLNPYGGDVGFFPLMVGVVGQFPKGFTTGLVTGCSTQNNLDTFNLSTSTPKVCVYFEASTAYYVPWLQAVVPLV
jgi:hypothetical protein